MIDLAFLLSLGAHDDDAPSDHDRARGANASDDALCGGDLERFSLNSPLEPKGRAPGSLCS